MARDDPQFSLRLATDPLDRMGAERLRYRVFVDELGGDDPLVDHDARRERDRFDAFADHMILVDNRREAGEGEHVIGAYRLLRAEQAAQAGQFYSEDEYDLAPLLATGRPLLELGRSCVHPDFRGGASMHLLWNGLTAYVLEHGVELLFGVASFHGTDVDALALPLSYLYHHHLAPPNLRARARPEVYQRMDLIPADRIERVAAMRATPALIKAYLRLGGFVGDGAFVDHAFNTTDVFLAMDTHAMNERARAQLTARVG